MPANWRDRVGRLGLDADAAAEAARHFERIEPIFRERFPDSAPARAWWVPGRIEVLGKHTDYGGGRSLLAAVGRGFHWLAAPAADGRITIVDARTGATCDVALAAGVAHQPDHWSNYVISVARRIARDFPGSTTGMRAVFSSSLPKAAGLSSSSALIVATFLPLAAFNRLDRHAAWTPNIPDRAALAGYLGAVESGRAFAGFPADHGVGTHGGSEDHAAILCCRAGHLSIYRFLPVAHEGDVALPEPWTFAIAVSGVYASKTGAARDHYNRLATEVARLVERSLEATGRKDDSLLTAIESEAGALERLRAAVADAPGGAALVRRLDQFAAESVDIIPAVAARLRAADVAGAGTLVDRSQQLAEDTLANQVPETVALARSARDLGAAAASAFGAGFGGAVWALVRRDERAAFIDRWRAAYRAGHPDRAPAAEFFGGDPGPAATEL
jgi:galactokinase